MSELSDAIDSVDVEEVLDELGIDYSRYGSSDEIILDECPYCGRTHKASFSVSKKVGHCFHAACEATWNVWSLSKHVLGNARDSFDMLMRLGRGVYYRPVRKTIEPTDWSMPDNIELPTPDGQTLKYLTDRRVLVETQSMFDLRYCHVGYYEFMNAEGNKDKLNFSKRVIIPIHDLDGEIKTFQGRDITGLSNKRYLFPTNLPGSGRFLYGANNFIGCKTLIINEGIFDVMATYQAIKGLPEYKEWGVAGTFGISLGHSDKNGDDQLSRLKKMQREGLENIVICYDGELNAYRKGVEIAQLLKSEGFKVKIATLPANQDPSSVRTQVVRDAINKAVNVTDEIVMMGMLASNYSCNA